MLICRKCTHSADFHPEVEYSDGYALECSKDDCECIADYYDMALAASQPSEDV